MQVHQQQRARCSGGDTAGQEEGRVWGGVRGTPVCFVCSCAVNRKMIDTMKSIKAERHERSPQSCSLGSLLLSPPPFPPLPSKCFLTSSQADVFARHVCPPVLVFWGSAGPFDKDFPAQGPAWLGASSSLRFLCQTGRPPPGLLPALGPSTKNLTDK